MKKSVPWKLFCGGVAAILAVGVAFQVSVPTIYAVSEEVNSAAASVSLKDEISPNGNRITQYVNDEDHQLKTIVWAKGITPPQMGGKDSQFNKELTYDKDGKVAYIDYIAPYIPGNGWYDVNKSDNFALFDMNLCFAAAASNSLHWWMDQNKTYIDRYLEMNPDDEQIQKLNDLRFSFENQKKSGVYKVFLNQFANKQDGYWPDILQDQFINGYYPKANGGTNDSPADRENLVNKGPDKNGGFFYKVFETDLLTQRREYINGFDAINREFKQLLLNGELVLMTYTVGPNKNHVVTVWGAEFDENGTISAVYFSDSDDEENQGMVRYRVFNVNGKAIVTTHVNGKSTSAIVSLQTLSLGSKQWNNYFNDSKKTLELVWSDTEKVYNGQVQAPTVSAVNIEPGDDITLSVEGGQTNVGEYIATAVLTGPAADKYELPQEHTHAFVIKKAPAVQITYPAAAPLSYGQTLANSALTGGSEQYGRFFWEDEAIVPSVNNSGYIVRFVPSEIAQQNYEQMQPGEKAVPIEIQKSKPAVSISGEVQHTADSATVTLSADLHPVDAGEIPTGTVTFAVTGENGEIAVDGAVNAVLENGKATVVWNDAEAGIYSVKANYSGSDNYSAASSEEILLDTRKQSQDSFEILPVEAKTYGDGAFELKEIGGSGTGAVTFESSDPNIIAIEGNTASIRKAGTVTITAIKAGDETYNPAKAVLSVTVNRKALTVTAEDKSGVVQGDAMPAFTYTVEGLVNGDQFADPILTVLPENTNVPGDYEIFIQGGSLTNAESYAVTYVNGTLSIQEKVAPPEPTAAPQPTAAPTPIPTAKPTAVPTITPAPAPTAVPTVEPTTTPVPVPTKNPEAESAKNPETGAVQKPAAPTATPQPAVEAGKNTKKQSETTAKPGGELTEKEDTAENAQAESPKPSDAPKATETPESIPTETQVPEENTVKPANAKTGSTIVNVVLAVLVPLALLVLILVLVIRKRNRSQGE